MKIATLLFTYNRSEHTKRVVDSLKRNTVMPQKLFVFQDGLKEGEEEDEWRKVSDVIHTIDWCENEIILSDYNKGLAESIVSGVGLAFQTYDAVIVLEDDCVPTANFLSFMKQCFEKYEDDKHIYSVSGYAWPINLLKDKYDIYACRRISSWGWGTWKDRWKQYEKDYEFIKKMKQKEETSRDLAMWGSDLEATLVGNIRGECDSWAVFWALTVIWNKGICINPYKSLISNIGFDGSGFHCGVSTKFEVEMMDDDKEEFSLPNRIRVSDEVKEAFALLYGSYTAISSDNGNDKERVLVYGQGNYFHEREKVLNCRYHIIAFIDSYKRGYYAGKEIIRPDDIKEYSFDKIVIAIKNIGECIKIIKNLTKKLKISNDLIWIDNFTEFNELRVTEDGDLLVVYDGTEIKISSLDEYNNVRESCIKTIKKFSY